MLNFFRKPFLELHFGAYGKLQSYGDFVRLDLDSKLSSFVRTWLTDSFPEGYPESTLDTGCRFFVVSDNKRKALSGVLVGSQDQRGRRFPFSAFTEVPLDQLGKNQYGELFAADFCQGRLESFLKLLSPIPVDPPLAPVINIQEVYEKLRTGKLRLERADLEGFRFESTLAKIDALALRTPLERRSPNALYAVLAELSQHLKGATSGDIELAAYRLPYIIGLGFLPQAVFWMRLIHAVHPQLPSPSMLCPIDEKRGNCGLWIAFRDLTHLDLRVALGVDATHDFVFDLTQADAIDCPLPFAAAMGDMHNLEELARRVPSLL